MLPQPASGAAATNTAVRRSRRRISRSAWGHLDEAVIEAGCAADVGEALVRHFVDVAAARPQLAPPHAQPIDDAGPRTRADDALAVVLAALVERAHQRAALDAARRGIVGMHLEQRLAFDVAQALDVDEARVEEIARRRRDHRQRIAGGQIRRRLYALV